MARVAATAVATGLMAILVAGCSKPDVADVEKGLVDRQGMPAEVAACMAPRLREKLDAGSLQDIVEKRKLTELPEDDAKTYNDVQSECADQLGYEVVPPS